MCHQKKTIALVFYFSVVASWGYSQSTFPKFEIGAGISGFIYQGDLTIHRSGSYETTRIGLNLHGGFIVNRSFILRTNLAFGGLRGNDAIYDNPGFRKHRNFNFRSPVVELSELFVWNPLGTNYKEKGLSPYLFAGVGLSFLHIKRDFSNFDTAYFGDGSDLLNRITLDEQHALPGLVPVVPLGVGVRYSISPALAINAETSYRVLFTDYLDGFSQAANPGRNDHYQTITAGVIYRVGIKNKLACPVLKY